MAPSSIRHVFAVSPSQPSRLLPSKSDTGAETASTARNARNAQQRERTRGMVMCIRGGKVMKRADLSFAALHTQETAVMHNSRHTLQRRHGISRCVPLPILMLTRRDFL